MKFLLAILVLLVFALSFVADHKWRKWMAQRQAQNPDQPHPDPSRPQPRP